MEFLVRIDLLTPPEVGAEELAELRNLEAQRAQELGASGSLVRLWRSSSKWGNWGLWQSESRESVVLLLDSLPLRPFMTIEIHELSPHPSDPLVYANEEEDQQDG